MTKQRTNRRTFLKSSACAGVGITIPYVFSAKRSFAAGEDAVAKNDRIKIGLIGAGNMGVGNLTAARKWCDTVAVADVDAARARRANTRLSEGKADEYSDYRKILERDDLDALLIATPDHWHTKPLVEALRAGFDVYCEKPLTLTINEGKLIRNVVRDTGQIVQVGTQQRSAFNGFVKAIAMVAAGRIGHIRRIQVAIGGAPASPAIPASETPRELDWDRWLGPAPVAEYRVISQVDGSERRRDYTNCHNEFRWWYQYSGGKLTDWGAHHVDIAMWALRTNGQMGGLQSISGEATHPVPFEGGYPTMNDRYNTATNFKLTARFPGDTEVIVRDDTRNGVLMEGDKGRIFVNRGQLTGKPVEDLTENPLPDSAIETAYKNFPLPEVNNPRQAHWFNFVHCLRERKEPISDVHSHMDALNICHLAGISARLGRRLMWDSEAEKIVGDEQANGFLAREYRLGYEIET